MADKLDLGKAIPDYLKATPKPRLIELPPLTYIGVEGSGAPGSDDFQAAISALYPMAWGIKMAAKFAGRDFKVMPLEGQFWPDPPGSSPAWDLSKATGMRWQLLILQPDFVGEAEMAAARAAHEARHGPTPSLGRVQLVSLNEGWVAQVMHVGAYDAEAPTIERLLAFIAAEGLQPRGRHHELYLSDPRRVPTERLRTIIRLPVEAKR